LLYFFVKLKAIIIGGALSKMSVRKKRKSENVDLPLNGGLPGNSEYLMENEREAVRLDLKTDPDLVKSQALWAGIRPGMRVADIGCGIGKTTFVLNEMVQPGGRTVGVDFSESRIKTAQTEYSSPTISYYVRDVRKDLRDLGKFDFIWIRFLLEYFRRGSFEIVRQLTRLLKKGGILCLIDLDCNCMNFYGAPPLLEKVFYKVMESLQDHGDFDPFVGRKLYSYLFDLKYEDIRVEVSSHHVTYGALDEGNSLNWLTKVETVARKGYLEFSGPGGYQKFHEEFEKFLNDPRRFIYSPLVACRGIRKP
jgi:ubiquinone/menaquinone biosynthesis C-methylase UbiE